MYDLIAWYRKQLDEDETALRELAKPIQDPALTFPMDARYRLIEAISERDPWETPGLKQLLADIAAKRVAIEHWENVDPYVMGPVIRALAAAYADRPGYKEEWKP